MEENKDSNFNEQDNQDSIKNKNSSKNKKSRFISKDKKINCWKYLFIALLTINIIFVGTIAGKIFMGYNSNVNPKIEEKHELDVANKVAKIEMTSSQVNNLVNSYLKDFQTSKMKYNFYLGDVATFTGTYKFLFMNIPLSITFTPLAMDNGDIELKVENISAGSINLPKDKALDYIKSTYDFPSFVSINGQKEKVTIALPQMELPNNFLVEVDQIDLKNEKLSFNLLQK
ncbi:YpmS family protein [Floricoccus penangensis]|uniref:YpmS family protein n=1 Tax=Floricoccus penangensis TaxID=1859475 RepID=UPI002040B240|nr:YpmS family protein [Floricoccus penangensis]URZ86732.1 DUF2140 family protein [Floricoccus penangensis]